MIRRLAKSYPTNDIESTAGGLFPLFPSAVYLYAALLNTRRLSLLPPSPFHLIRPFAHDPSLSRPYRQLKCSNRPLPPVASGIQYSQQTPVHHHEAFQNVRPVNNQNRLHQKGINSFSSVQAHSQNGCPGSNPSPSLLKQTKHFCRHGFVHRRTFSPIAAYLFSLQQTNKIPTWRKPLGKPPRQPN